MAVSNRRFKLAAILFPLLFLAMSGLSRAATIVVNSTSGEPDAPLCSLPDAIAAANGTPNSCTTGTGSDTIVFDVTGTITIDETLLVTDSDLTIDGPQFGGIIIDGGGNTQILDHEMGDLTLNNLTFQHGFADSMVGIDGGAILANSTGNLAINNCTFTNNLAVAGGAIFGGSGNVTIINSTFAGNTADPTMFGSGGAIFNNGSTMDITNCTFSKNVAATDSGGGLGWQIGFAPSVKSTILESIDPSGTIDDSDNCQGNVADAGFNISDDETCFTAGTSLNNTPLNLDPDGLENNGGPTQTIEPEAGSKAIDFVPIANCKDQAMTPQPVTTDQRLFARPDPGNLSTCDAGAFEVGALAPIVLNSERVQIARSTSPYSDQVNMGLTFTYNGDPDCDKVGDLAASNLAASNLVALKVLDDDALNDGVGIGLVEGTCADLPDSGLFVTLRPFVVHTVNGQSYGTFFQSMLPKKVSARMVALATPMNACGKWTLNLQVSGLNTSSKYLGLGGSNPFAILISDLYDFTGCFDINNAIVGSQIIQPVHVVRRGVRR